MNKQQQVEIAPTDWHSAVPAGYRRNERGDLVRLANIQPRDVEMDKIVDRIHGFGHDLSQQISRFREYTLNDIMSYVERVVSEYGGKIGGAKGNVQLTSFDGCKRVQLAQAQVIEAGPEIAAVNAIIDECIADWSKYSNLNLRALVDAALKPNAAGQISVSALLKLRRVEIDDPRWRKVQEAISDALRPTGRAEYIRLYKRETPEQPWHQVPLNLAHVAPVGALTGEDAQAVLYRRLDSAMKHARLNGLKEREISHIATRARQGKPLADDEGEIE